MFLSSTLFPVFFARFIMLCNFMKKEMCFLVVFIYLQLLLTLSGIKLGLRFYLAIEFTHNFHILFFIFRHGSSPPPMFTEMLPGNQMLALIITQVTETMAGEYICWASYASTENLKASVNIHTYGNKKRVLST